MKKYICIHGHFYQPPRENPWLGEVELQDSAYPYHDWNGRITEECYAPNTASRILDSDGRIIDISSNYAKMSFNFGPTLLSWLERLRPGVYREIIAADGRSMERFGGHGSAMAQVYNHMIMPLANHRDKHTQALWGKMDFQRRFGRDPEGMWLPETAVDIETLEVLADLGIRFTVLAPRQAHRIRQKGSSKWIDVTGGKIDPRKPYLCRLPSGKSIALYFFDGPISQDVSFGGLLRNGAKMVERLHQPFGGDGDEAQLVHIATDGETFGHHHRSGDMALAYALHLIESQGEASLTNYGEYLERFPPGYVVEIFEDSSWSCIHGVERWRENCGCHIGGGAGWTQRWRRPLREAMDWLRDELVEYFSSEASRLLRDPWKARDEYLEVMGERDRAKTEAFLVRHASREIDGDEKKRLIKLLEMQKNALFMYTSCGWFFDEISGIETVQVMSYAAQAMQYVEELDGITLEGRFKRILEDAPSNVMGNGALAYEKMVSPARVDLSRVGAHYGIYSLFSDYREDISVYCYSGKSERYDRVEAGRVRLVTGIVRIVSDVTWDEERLTFAVLHLGDQNISGGVGRFSGNGDYEAMQIDIGRSMEMGDIPGVIRSIDTYFGSHTYNLWHLFRDEQRKVLNEILKLTYDEIEASYRLVYSQNSPIMNFLHSMNIPLPKPLSVAAEYILNRDLQKALQEEHPDRERLEEIIGSVTRWSLEIDRTTCGYCASRMINGLMEGAKECAVGVENLLEAEWLLNLLHEVDLELDLWKAQNIYFSIRKKCFQGMKEIAEKGDDEARSWVDLFLGLGSLLHIKMS